ncbi:MAG: hypothetical protein GYA17_02565, partial [Chloroflexi bacterium]|nr:hypothetical protein [Chloroflexota bacterium]
AGGILYANGGVNWLADPHTMDTQGSYTLSGNADANNAKIYVSGSLKATLTSDGSVTAFGHGASVINGWTFVVGTESGNKLFNYRQRGSLWTYRNATLPAPLPKSKFGSDVAIDGNIAVIGAQDFDNRGAAFVFVRDTASSETWSYQATLQSIDIGTGDKFGSAVAFHEGHVVVGAPNANNAKGVAYVFERTGDTWNQWARLAPQDLSYSAQFGAAVDVYKNTLVIGAPGMNAAYVYTRENAVWEQQTRLSGSDEFGSSVAVDEDTILVGSPAQSSNTGGATVFTRSEGVWSQQAWLHAAGGTSGDRFGSAVDVSGDNAIVGAPGVSSNSGAAYAFQRNGTAWSQIQQIVNPVPLAGSDDYFGNAVAIDGDLMVVGAYRRTVTRVSGGQTFTYADEGAAFAFGLKNGIWQLQTVVEPLQASDGTRGDYIGYAVAISGSLVLVGAPQFDGRSAYIPTALNTDGAGYIYITEISAPMTVTYPQAQNVVIAGAKTNVVSGTAGGQEIAEIIFFDIPSFTLTTGASADLVQLSSDGLQAHGLQHFTLNTGAGDDTFDILTDDLSLPTEGQFIPGNLDGLEEGDPLTPAESEQLYTRITPTFTYNGGASSTVGDTLIFTADADLTLEHDRLVSSTSSTLFLSAVENAFLTGGMSQNLIQVNGWTGTVDLDAGGGSDVYELDLSTIGYANVADSGTGGAERDRLTILGTSGGDYFTITGTQVSIGSKMIDFGNSQVEVIGIAAQAGNDTLLVNNVSVIDEIELDGMAGYDTYVINVCGSQVVVTVRDSNVEGKNTLLINGSEGDDVFVVGATQASCNAATVNYDNTPETFTVDGGAGNDTFTVNGNSTNLYGTASVLGGAGDDTFTINGVGVYGLVVDGQSGSDSYRVGTNLGGPLFANDSGSGANDNDYALIYGTAGADEAVLTATQVIVNSLAVYSFSSFNSGAQSVGGLEGVNIDLLGGDDVITINAIPTNVGVAISGGGGNDTFLVANLPSLYGSGAHYGLRLYGNEGDDTLNVDASANGTGSIYSDKLTGFGMLLPLYVYDTNGWQLVSLTLSAGNDVLSLNGLNGAYTVDGGAGSDTLAGTNTATTWTLTAVDAGNIGGAGQFDFSAFENLTGGSGADTFVLAGGSLSGTLNGGAGSDSLDYSAYTTTVVVNLQNGTATSLGAFASVESVLSGTALDDTLVGADTANTWNITGDDAGNLDAAFFFTSFENLTGGSEADVFRWQAGVRLSGLLDGGAGSDTLVGADTANTWNVTGANAGSLASLVNFTGVENLTGGSEADTFVLAGGSLSGTLNGGAGSDSL